MMFLSVLLLLITNKRLSVNTYLLMTIDYTEMLFDIPVWLL